jgi:hypothetical protein
MHWYIKKLSTVVALLLFAPASAWACFNGYAFHGTHASGTNDILGFEKLPKRHFGKLEHGDTLCQNFKDSSDYAVYLIKQGYLGRGLIMLHELSLNYPQEYVIAANLGTAYELSGLNDSALRWIEYSLMLNPNAHEGTEWVHTDILKAKIASAKDPNWLKTHHVLNIDRSNYGEHIYGSSQKSKLLREVLNAIYIQLTERLPFTAPGDLIMGDICTDAALIIEYTSIEAGMAWWKLADEFGVPTVSPDPKDKIKKLEQLGRSIPVLAELAAIPVNDSAGSTTTHTEQYVHLSFFSFDKFSENKAWKLKDEEVLKNIITNLQQSQMVLKLNLATNLQESSTVNTLWFWIGGIVAVVLLLILLIKRGN